jgi:hypothetical protein
MSLRLYISKGVAAPLPPKPPVPPVPKVTKPLAGDVGGPNTANPATDKTHLVPVKPDEDDPQSAQVVGERGGLYRIKNGGPDLLSKGKTGTGGTGGVGGVGAAAPKTPQTPKAAAPPAAAPRQQLPRQQLPRQQLPRQQPFGKRAKHSGSTRPAPPQQAELQLEHQHRQQLAAHAIRQTRVPLGLISWACLRLCHTRLHLV